MLIAGQFFIFFNILLKEQKEKLKLTIFVPKTKEQKHKSSFSEMPKHTHINYIQIKHGCLIVIRYRKKPFY